MKTMKKVASIALALMLLLSLAVPGLAATTNSEQGGEFKITVNADANQTGSSSYEVYKIFDATVSGEDPINISYTKTTAGLPAGFHEDYGFVRYGAQHSEGETTPEDLTDTDIANLESFVENLTAVGTITIAEGEKDGTLTGLEAGYYYIKTNTGSAVTVTSISPVQTVYDKNGVPSVKKEIEGSHKVVKGVGDTVEYTVTITVENGAAKYVLHDQMGTGLQLDANSVKVNGAALTGTIGNLYQAPSFTDAPNWVDTDGDSFVIVFDDAWLALQTGDIVVTYSAKITATSDLTNTATVTYGDAQNPGTKPTPDGDDDDDDDDDEENSGKVVIVVTTVKVKNYDQDDTSKSILAGAGFTLTRETDEGTIEYYQADGTWAATEAVHSTEEADLVFTNLLEGTYTLTETKAPDGYNMLNEGVTIEVDAEGSVKVNGQSAPDEDNENENTYNVTIDIPNAKGAQLPSTGGIGTTIFTVLGSALMIGAAILFITKKRSSAN